VTEGEKTKMERALCQLSEAKKHVAAALGAQNRLEMMHRVESARACSWRATEEIHGVCHPRRTIEEMGG
jgi:hypothetical protein